MPVAELQQANGITDARGLNGAGARAEGVRAAGCAVCAARRRQSVSPRVARRLPALVDDSRPSSTAAHTTRVAAASTRRCDALRDDAATGAIAPPAQPQQSVARGNDKLRWPVSGKIITGFGQRNDGTHNDGINLSVPLGTAVHAAESGTVAYAGSELKGYGNSCSCATTTAG